MIEVKANCFYDKKHTRRVNEELTIIGAVYEYEEPQITLRNETSGSISCNPNILAKALRPFLTEDKE